MIHDSIVSCVGQTPLVHLRRLFPFPEINVIAKLELLNPGGSVKDRPARFILEHGLRAGLINARTPIVESSSGNLGVALAMVARCHGLHFTCVVDPKISPANLRILRALGAEVDMVHERDEQGGYLGTRIRRVRQLVQQRPGAVWINQYANELNWRSHHDGEGEEVLAALDRPVDILALAVSTTGTIHGLARRLRAAQPGVRVVAVDAVGSIIFGGPPARRELPGMGGSRVPELLCRDEIDDVLLIDDRASVAGCRALARHEGIFAGGSSGAVVAAIRALIPRLPRRNSPTTILTILPDRGDRYLDLVYDDAWVEGLPGVPAELRTVQASTRAERERRRVLPAEERAHA